MKRVIIQTVIFALFPLLGYSQHEISVYGGGGLSGLNYSVNTGKQENGLGGQFGLGYHYFFTPRWGVGTGVEFAMYNTTFKAGNIKIVQPATDIEGSEFEFRTSVNNCEEKQKAAFLQIPLMLQYQTGAKHRFYAAGGLKAGIPLSGTYSSTAASLNNSGYYSEEIYEYNTQRFMGFGTFNNIKSDGNLEFKTALLASLEAGMKWKLSNKLSLYTGAYMDYGLNNTAETSSSAFMQYNTNNPTGFALNSIANSQYTQNDATQPQSFTGKISPIAAGVKLRLALGIQKKSPPESIQQPAPQPTPKEQPKPEEPPAPVKPEPNVEQAKVEPAKEKPVLLGSTASYGLSETNLSDNQKRDLDEIIVALKQKPDTKFHIYGHTCEIGGDLINERIGLQRAQKAKTYILSKGISENRILDIASKRCTEPLAPNTNEENRRMNRRVEVVVLTAD